MCHKLLLIHFVFLTLLCSCVNTPPVSAKKKIIPKIILHDLIEMRNEMRNLGRKVSITLNGKQVNIAAKDSDATHSDMNGDHDSMLWAGLLCYSGEEDQCEAVMASQEKETGRMWRSPLRVQNDTGYTFSRDMSLGTLAFLLKKKNEDGAKNLAKSWTRYLNSTGARLCPDPLDNQKEEKGLWGTKDLRCNLPDPYRAIYWHIFKQLELVSQNNLLENYDTTIFKDEKNAKEVCAILKLAAADPQLLIQNDFNLHLFALEIFLRQQSQDKLCDNNALPLGYIARAISERQPDNPFYTYLKGDYLVSATQTWAQLKILKEFQSPPRWNTTSGLRQQWSFERNTDSKAFMQSMFWEYVFLINLLVATQPL